MLTVVGLGYGKDELSVKGLKAIQAADKVIVRSKRGAGRFIKTDADFDAFTLKAENYDELNRLLAREVLKAEKDAGNLVYCVEGSGATDGSVRELFSLASVQPVVIGAAPHVFPSEAVFTVAAASFGEFELDTAAALTVVEIADRFLAGDVKLRLLDFYPPAFEVLFGRGGSSVEMPLEELDRQRAYDSSCSVTLPPAMGVKERYCFADLLRVMKKLTSPAGCPWDKAQTHESIRINLIEEAYEAAAALSGGDLDEMAEELGDVMLQAVFHCDIAARSGEFTLNDVVTALCRKLVFRHSHIFAGHAADAAEALGFWERAKAEEKKYTSLSDQIQRLPKDFAAALRAEKLFKKINKLIGAEAAQVAVLLNSNSGDTGKLLFLAAAAAALKGEHAETALLDECFRIEEAFKAKEKDVPPPSLEQLL